MLAARVYESMTMLHCEMHAGEICVFLRTSILPSGRGAGHCCTSYTHAEHGMRMRSTFMHVELPSISA